MSEAFEEYCSLFHQDTFIIDGNLENAIEANVGNLHQERLKELEIYLETVLLSEDISSKTLLRKAISDISFYNTKSARQFLEQTLSVVRHRLQKIREDKIKFYSRE